MDQEQPSAIKTTENQTKKTNNKTLKRLERPIYEVKKKDESETQYVIRKLIEQKNQKPKIEAVQRSSLLTQLQSFMPKIKQADLELKSRPIVETEKIDAKLEKVQYESSSSDDEQQQKGSKQLVSSQMDEQNQDVSQTNQIEMNFLRYELPGKMEPTEVQQISEHQKEKIKKKLIQEL